MFVLVLIAQARVSEAKQPNVQFFVLLSNATCSKETKDSELREGVELTRR
jgi:hypothetical protein